MPARQSFAPQSEFIVLASRRMGLYSSEFDVKLCDGHLEPHHLINFTERGTVWEYLIWAVQESAEKYTLVCINWVPVDGAFVGYRLSSRPMKAIEKRRYAKHLSVA